MRWLLALAASAILGVSSSAGAEWKRYETAHFIIYSASGDARAAKRAADLEKIDGLMRLATGLSSDVKPVKVRIYELANEGDVQAAYGGNVEGLAGYYASNAFGPFAVTERTVVMAGGSAFTPDVVLHHEYAHHFMLQYFPAEYPGWYIEGFAELIGASKILDDGRVAYGFPAKYRGGSLAAEWLPMQDVLTVSPDKVRRYDVYGQGWAMTHFLTFTKGRSQQLRAFLGALSAGRSSADAAKVFGDLGELNRQARTYVSQGAFDYKLVNVPIESPIVKRTSVVGFAEAALLPEIAAFKDYDLRAIKKDSERQQEVRRRSALLERIRAKASKFPSDAFALYVLTEAENASGSKTAAEAAVDRLLAIDPHQVRALIRKSLLTSEAAGRSSGPTRLAKAAEARSLAMRANALDGNEPLSYVAFYQGFRGAGLKPTANAVSGLEAAVDKLPDDTNVRRLLVEEYADEHRWREAIQTLKPIANEPHETPLRAEARERMAQLQTQLNLEAITASKPK